MITLPSAAAIGAAASPSTFDGSRPLLCSADRGHDCTPGAYDCSESLVLQGADLLLAWSALINKSTGALSVSDADRHGSYVVFAAARMPRTSRSSAIERLSRASDSRSRLWRTQWDTATGKLE